MKTPRVQRISQAEALALAHPDRWGGHILGSTSALPPQLVEDLHDPTQVTKLDRYEVVRSFRAEKGTVRIFDSSQYAPLTVLGLQHELIGTDEGHYWTPDDFVGIEPAQETPLALGQASIRLGPSIMDIQMHSVGLILPGHAHHKGETDSYFVQRTALRQVRDRLVPTHFRIPGRIAIGQVQGNPGFLARVSQVDVLVRTEA